MAEYISREAVNDLIEDVRNNHFILMCDRVTLALLKSKVSEIPAADVQPVDRWISVDDRLPEQDEKVLVLTKDKDIMTMIYKVIPFRWYKPKFGGFDKDYVTQWKPLPELPNGGDSE